MLAAPGLVPHGGECKPLRAHPPLTGGLELEEQVAHENEQICPDLANAYQIEANENRRTPVVRRAPQAPREGTGREQRAQ